MSVAVLLFGCAAVGQPNGNTVARPHGSTEPRLVSVIIPALDEEAVLPATLASIAQQPGPVEVIVADGGSADRTRAIAEAHGATVVSAPRGRARQMNAGAAQAQGKAFVFLHADTTLPPDGLALVRQTLAAPEVAGGCFRTTFDRESAWLRLWTSRAWMRWWRFAFGDRAAFTRRATFEALGGFPDQPIFEDLDFVRALRRRGRFVFLDAPIQTSARRYERYGDLGQQLRNWALWGAWCLGAAPERCARFYPAARTERE
ncbi:MAG: TIGR04283 family arsenosugar biosynthesis glycosyltransferase [Bacteroidota bacterium]